MGDRRMEIKSRIWLRFQECQLAQLKDAMCSQGGIGSWNHFIGMETDVQHSSMPCLRQVCGLFPQNAQVHRRPPETHPLQERTSRGPKEEMNLFPHHMPPSLTNKDPLMTS